VRSRRSKIFVDAEHLVLEHVSGIAQYTVQLVAALRDEVSDSNRDGRRFELGLGTWYRRFDRLQRFPLDGVARRRVPVPVSVTGLLKEHRLLPPIDLLMGRAVYLFPNYSSWPVLRSPAIVFVYDLSFIRCPEYLAPKNHAFMLAQVPRSIRRATKVLTVSEFSRTEIIDEFGVDPDDVFVCQPGVDPSSFRRRPTDEIEVVKARYGITGDYILFVGTIEPRKGITELLHAYERLPADVRDRYGLLLVGGRGWLDDDIRATTTRLRRAGNRVLRPDDFVHDRDLPALYSGAALFVAPSLYEGFGIPPLEAMACGVPVITSNNSSLPEVVGDAAVMIDPRDPDELAGAIEKVLADDQLRRSLAVAGRERAGRFSYRRSARQLLNVIEEIA